MATTHKTKFRSVICGECKVAFTTDEPRKLFCDSCGIKRRLNQRKRGIDATRRAQSPALKNIALSNAERREALFDGLAKPIHFAWSVFFSIPYSLNASKNRRWSNSGHGVVYLSKEVRSFEASLIIMARQALRETKVHQAKLWVGIFVQKPNNKSDAINVVDTICDALKKAVGLDDRWFCLSRVDWEIQKHDPQIYIRVSQEVERDMIACSHCGIILPAETFSKKKSGHLGHGRVCRSCTSIVAQERKVARKAIADASI